MRSEEYAPYLQDEYVTLREDRFVLPLKASFKSMGLGIVHDTSRSGETVFVEPTAHGRAEQPAQGGGDRDPPGEPAHPGGAGRADRRGRPRPARRPGDPHPAGRHLRRRPAGGGLRRRARWRSSASRSSICASLRHPLLALRAAQAAARAVVPNDVALGEVPGKSEAQVLVVSGPNAGGKTVLLKAVGLAALCARAGLLVPAAPGSRVGFFDRVLADIGDQQSVLGDLSTFSAHLANIARIVEAVRGAGTDEHLLVLCDELMAGTHPEQGAALARATLEALADGPALVITTTHYDSLKALTEGDAPLPQRRHGIRPARSCAPPSACATACPGGPTPWTSPRAWACPTPVLERARSWSGPARWGWRRCCATWRAREEALAAAEEALDAGPRASWRRAPSEEKAAAAVAGPRASASWALRSREVIDRAVRERPRGHRRGGARGAPAAHAGRRRRRPAEAGAGRARRPRAGLPEPAPLAALDVDKLREALAVAGAGRERRQGQPAAARERAPRPRQQPPPSTRARDEVPAAAARPAANAVDVRGKRADEALRRAGGVPRPGGPARAPTRVFVIHGHGTGALRKAVREYLATSPYVDRFRPGGAGEGGDGVSVVSLRGLMPSVVRDPSSRRLGAALAMRCACGRRRRTVLGRSLAAAAFGAWLAGTSALFVAARRFPAGPRVDGGGHAAARAAPAPRARPSTCRPRSTSSPTSTRPLYPALLAAAVQAAAARLPAGPGASPSLAFAGALALLVVAAVRAGASPAFATGRLVAGARSLAGLATGRRGWPRPALVAASFAVTGSFYDLVRADSLLLLLAGGGAVPRRCSGGGCASAAAGRRC